MLVLPRTHRKKSTAKQTRLDYVVDVAIFLAPLSLLPQLFSVWQSSDTNDVYSYMVSNTYHYSSTDRLRHKA
jgi:hypothetical protein